jgi:hypothetical protein
MSISHLHTKSNVGDIFHDSMSFFQVVQTTNKMIKLKAIGRVLIDMPNHMGQSRFYIPNSDSNDGALLQDILKGVFSKRLQFHCEIGYFIRSLGNWNGKPVECNGG